MQKQTQTKKSLKYSVAVKIVNFDPLKYGSKIIIVDGAPALKIRERIYIKLK